MRDHISNFFLSVQPFLKKYAIESGLIIIAGALAIGALAISTLGSPTPPSDNFVIKEKSPNREKIMIDIQGALKKPGVYQFPLGSRLNDAIMKADGLSEEADIVFFAKKFNRASLLEDQQKIYIPSKEEITAGDFTNLTSLPGVQKPNLDYSESQISLIPINSATVNELDSLPGIGVITAQKIIDNRPYGSLEELLSKKIVKSNVYEEIKDQLSMD